MAPEEPQRQTPVEDEQREELHREPEDDYVGRAAGKDAGYAGETGAERRKP